MTKAKHDESQKKIDELESQLKRTLADYQNLEKRTIEERRELIKSASKGLILRLLPTLDTLILAKQHVKDEGLDLSVKQFTDALKNEGVEKIQTIGQNFDPNTMEAVETRQGEEGKVLDEARAGYLMNGKVLRPAQVVVGKAKIDQKEKEEAKEEMQRGDYM